MKKQYKIGIVIMRSQLCHLGHIELLKKAFEVADKVKIFIGSCNSPRTIDNPFNYEERRDMLTDVIWNNLPNRGFHIIPINDYIYDNPKWKKQITDVIFGDHAILKYSDICMIGGSKGEWYMSLFPEYDHIVPENIPPINATDIRKAYFCNNYDQANKYIKPLVPQETYEFLQDFRSSKWFGYIACSWGTINDLNGKYGKGPFLTSDILAIKDDHILLIERKNHPGKGLFAMPGGFIEVNESFKDAALRELREEACPNITHEQFDNSLMRVKLYDHPKRSIVSRIVTQVHYLDLNNVDINIEAGDDASKAFWYPIKDIDKILGLFYDDHESVIMDYLELFDYKEGKL